MCALTVSPANLVRGHLNPLDRTLAVLRHRAELLARWGGVLGERLRAGNRLLTAGDDASAHAARYFATETVGRDDPARRPFAALALGPDLASDSGEAFARQVTAHARPRDVLVLLATPGGEHVLVRAAEEGRKAGATVWALTGPEPGPLASAAEETLSLRGTAATVPVGHLVAVQLLCAAVEQARPQGRDHIGDLAV
ncbi:D-sedoheptulose 7-phosphate isomerase [Prauserella shujinwangii]|uniref:D-sedoheptulose 7-phosphate isomerase n=1 Tax=Prauserella shujinwangii TaxID=1453103 RepID=A0A2T0M2M2_9PSEU|nr:SIS domain-containing protein [Prauserella shujinwangii]PRX51011.1 D-sedoheptulose 7-phosphate isomerase [Prauserella shujinwangii]